MTQVVASGRRAQSLGEEIANSISHGVGLLAAVVVAPVLIADAAQRGGATGVISVAEIPSDLSAVLHGRARALHCAPIGRASRSAASGVAWWVQ